MTANEPAPLHPLDQPRFFPVSVPKLVVMCLVTFGVYEFYWVYRNWCLERDYTRAALSPFWRTLFFPIWVFNLLNRVRGAARDAGLVPGWTVGLLSVAFVIWSCAALLPKPYGLASIPA